MANAIVPEKLGSGPFGSYESWSACMKNYLLSHDLWDLIEPPSGSEPPKQEVSEAEFKAWRKKNATALHAIQISCSPSVFRKTEMSTDSAKVAWDNLATSFRKPLEPVSKGIVSKPLQPVPKGIVSKLPSDDTDSDLSDDFSDSEFDDSSDEMKEPEWKKGLVKKGDYTRFAGLVNSVYRGDWHSIRNFLDRDPGVINEKITSFGLTALHIAAQAGNVEIGGKLIELMSKEALAIQDGNGDIALHYAACRGLTKMARFMVEKNDTLVAIPNKWRVIPVALACANGHRDTTIYLLSVTTFEVLSLENGIHGSILLRHAITSKMLDIALEIFHGYPSFAAAADATRDAYLKAALWALLAASSDLFPSGCQLGFWQRLIYSCIPIQPLIASKFVNAQILDQSQQELKIIMQQVLGKWSNLCIKILEFSGIKKIYDLKMIHAYSSRILCCMCENMSKLDDNTLNHIGVPGAFWKAVEIGSVELVLAMVEISPSLQYTTDLMGRHLIMSSIVHRQEKVFNLFYGLARHNFVVDKFGKNTLLHLAGTLSPSTSYRLNQISGAALQMQRELQWYKEVESIGNHAAKFSPNQYGETPGQLFTKQHKKLVTEGKEWMEGKAICCLVAAAFIIAITFGAAFTVPGGNIQDIGIPVFFHRKAFMTFVISDAISLFASSTSALMFFGILTTHCAEQDFLISLPRKLIIGLSMLFVAIAAMMVAFCAALIIKLNGKLEVVIPIISLVGIPFTLFMFFQFPLLVEIVMSTYGPSIFNRKKNSIFNRKKMSLY